jgi:hypothetical protein
MWYYLSSYLETTRSSPMLVDTVTKFPDRSSHEIEILERQKTGPDLAVVWSSVLAKRPDRRNPGLGLTVIYIKCR